MSRPLLLDLFCGQGGASQGYYRAGFDVVGVDICPQPRYPFQLSQRHWRNGLREILGAPYRYKIVAIHASPPCQAYSAAQRIRGFDHPDLIADVRAELELAGLPYVIENVPGARPWLRNPVLLCGTMFPALRVYRHRLFETNWPLAQPAHGTHVAPQVKMGRPPKPGEWIQPVGNFSGVSEARAAMEMPWASREGLREAIPPAYTEYVGRQMLQVGAIQG